MIYWKFSLKLLFEISLRLMIEACIAIIIDAETTKFKDYTREMYYLFPMGNIDVIQQSLYKKKGYKKAAFVA